MGNRTAVGKARWTFWQWRDIPDRIDPSQTYLRRLNLLGTPWFSIKVHNIRLPDRERALHDHPWGFVTLILRGGYIEELPDGTYVGKPWNRHLVARRPGSIHLIRAEGLHRIRTLADKPTWTLVFTGRRQRQWGFSHGPGHWVPADKYLDD